MNKITHYKILKEKFRNAISKPLLLLLLLISFVSVSYGSTTETNSSALMQQIKTEKISINIKEKSLKEIFTAICKKADIKYGIKNDVAMDDKAKYSLNVTDVTVHEAFQKLLEKTKYDFQIDNDVVVIVNRVEKKPGNVSQKVSSEIKGKVIGTNKKPIIGATVIVLGTTNGGVTEDNGHFSIKAAMNSEIEISCVGYKTILLKTNSENMVVTLEEDAIAVDDVIVSGYFRKTKQSNTGAEVQVKGEQLRQVGSLNFLQAISVFDPSVRTIESNEFGSDPNRVPEITIRGENGFDLRGMADDSKTNPNSPLYILDGLEVSATRVYDLDMNRVESFTILKDASATSLYGSRGANGVIVIQTLRPREGEIKVTVNANFNVSIPDLRDYNLMNATEKLEYERLAGEYKSNWNGTTTQYDLDMAYNEKLKEIRRGVDTYWLSQPLRTSVNQRYNAYIEGGDGSFRYGIDLKYDTDKGVMKKSGREKIGAALNFNYNIGQKFYIINYLTVNDVKGENSPYGSLSNFAIMNPYERMYDERGELIRTYERTGSSTVNNPLVNALLPNYNYEKYTEIEDNLSLDWRISQHFVITARVGLTKKISKDEIYRSPLSTDFEMETEVNKRGSYNTLSGNSLDFDGNFTAAYNNTFKNDMTLSAGIGGNIVTSNNTSDGYTATGFINDNLNFVKFAQQFKEESTPDGSFDKSRMVGVFANLNVGYKNRYFIDGSFRTDGSSRFGRDSRFAPFWSVGGAWNIDKENWWTGDGSMKLRASVGSTGTVNFSADQALTKYRYDASNEYNGVYGAVLMGYGNSSLKWQNTLQYNIGVDMNIWKNILTLNIDAYIKQTQNLLLPIDVVPSTGFGSYTENMGSMENKGVDFRLRFNIISRPKQDLHWSVTFAGSHNTNRITKLSNALEAMNAEANLKENATSAQPLRTYQPGRSQSALLVVRSMGIDPATGNEVFVKLNGDLTFDYDTKDKIVAGDTSPKFQGNLQSNLNFKGFNLFFVFAYEFGAVAYNSTLADKVEGADPKRNADKRVLYDRWKNPGDVAMFRRIDDKERPYQTTRLVQDNDVVRLQSLSLSYQVPDRYLANTFIERAKISFTTSDLFRISTVKLERGTSYPFAQTFSIGLNVTF